jgi:hypothetical protein
MKGANVPTPPTISEGSQGEVVEWAQYLLVRFALSDNQIDGNSNRSWELAVCSAPNNLWSGRPGLRLQGRLGFPPKR